MRGGGTALWYCARDFPPSYATRQSDADQVRRLSLQCSWTSSLEPSADGPQTAGIATWPFQTVALDVFYLVSGTKAQCEPPL